MTSPRAVINLEPLSNATLKVEGAGQLTLSWRGNLTEQLDCRLSASQD